VTTSSACSWSRTWSTARAAAVTPSVLRRRHHHRRRDRGVQALLLRRQGDHVGAAHVDDGGARHAPGVAGPGEGGGVASSAMPGSRSMVLYKVLRLNTYPADGAPPDDGGADGARRREVSGGRGADAAAAVRPSGQGRVGGRCGRVHAGEVCGGGVQGVQGRAGVLPVRLGATHLRSPELRTAGGQDGARHDPAALRGRALAGLLAYATLRRPSQARAWRAAQAQGHSQTERGMLRHSPLPELSFRIVERERSGTVAGACWDALHWCWVVARELTTPARVGRTAGRELATTARGGKKARLARAEGGEVRCRVPAPPTLPSASAHAARAQRSTHAAPPARSRVCRPPAAVWRCSAWPQPPTPLRVGREAEEGSRRRRGAGDGRGGEGIRVREKDGGRDRDRK
jgi:hypothetical protein